MIRRTFDPAFLNTVVNHPEVRPWLKGDGVLDVTDTVCNPSNFALVSEFGGFILLQHEIGRYEVHSQFLPGHGTHPIRAMHAALEWMFTRSDCEAIVSHVPRDNKAAKGLAITGGLRTIFERRDAILGDCEYVELTVSDWAMRTKALEAHGERFHRLIDDWKCDTGSDLPVHEHDATHERAVGAAVLMIERGQPVKGVNLYNRWARLARYAPVTLVSVAPVVVDAVDAVLGMGSEGMEVLLCR